MAPWSWLFLIGCSCLPLCTHSLVLGGNHRLPQTRVQQVGPQLLQGAGSDPALGFNRLRGGFVAKWGGPSFEFTSEQEAVFAETAKLMGRAGNFYVVESVALVISFAMTVADTKQFTAKGAVLLFWGIHHGWCGIHAMRGAECFHAIKRTQGNDIDYLMDAVMIQKEYWKQLMAPAYVRIACIVILIAFHVINLGDD